MLYDVIKSFANLAPGAQMEQNIEASVPNNLQTTAEDMKTKTTTVSAFYTVNKEANTASISYLTKLRT